MRGDLQEMRIYPSHLKRVSLEPRAEDFRVLDVDSERGQGVMVLRRFRRGQRLFRMNGTLTTEMTLHSLQMAPGLHLDDPYFAGKVLHSCAPNSRLDAQTRLFIAERDIEEGDLLTMDYDETEDVLFRSFWCRCGADHCRGEIVGRLGVQPAEVAVFTGVAVPIDSLSVATVELTEAFR
jgi:uncharacterized protein